MRFKTTVVYDYLLQSKKKITIMQGGTRSSKTYNILIWFIIKLLQEQGKVLTICRKTVPSIKATVLRDFIEILENNGLYDESLHNRTDNIYKLNNNIVEFVSLDEPQKIRGRKRDYLFLNEANEDTLQDWIQLIFRTTDKIILDFNPSDEFHWIYDEVIPRDDADFYITTYKDNVFLSPSIVKEIERLKEQDENLWRVYGLGQRGTSEAVIYKNWQETDIKEPDGETYYGLDFGYNHPSVLTKIIFFDDGIYIKEIFYEKGLTNQDLINLLYALKIDKNAEIYGDSARPENIEEIYRAGFNIHPCKKGKDSVKLGIDHIKRHKLFVDKNSINLIKEIKSYKWKQDKNNKILDEPVKFNDDCMDAMRYAFNPKLEHQDEFGILEGLPF